LLVCGENEGYIDIIFLPTLELTVGKRFEKIGHIYQIQATSLKNEMVVCSYTGVHFVKIYVDKITGAMSLHLNEVCYITEQFVNKVIEFEHGRFLAALWDSNKYMIIDHEQEKIASTIPHPLANKQNSRCWGMAKAPGYDYGKLPFIVCRDNTGIVFVDVNHCKAYVFAVAPIKQNLFGHGEILKIVLTDVNLPGGAIAKIP